MPLSARLLNVSSSPFADWGLCSRINADEEIQISYVISPLMAFIVVGALHASKTAI
jgi:hypothetical protein